MLSKRLGREIALRKTIRRPARNGLDEVGPLKPVAPPAWLAPRATIEAPFRGRVDVLHVVEVSRLMCLVRHPREVLPGPARRRTFALDTAEIVREWAPG